MDTGLYHAQAIKWIETYRVVPGLGNLHGRLAFDFSWFLPNALFSLSFLNLQPLHVLNPLLLIMVLAMAFAAAADLLKGPASLANLLKISLIIPVTLVFKDQLSSPNVDLPAALIIMVLFIYLVELLEDHRATSHGLGLVVIAILAAYVTTIKLSSIPIMIFSLFVLGKEISARKYRETILLAGIIMLVFLPWIIRNIILSGYIVYPFPYLDLFNFDWKIPHQAAVAESQAIAHYARNPGLISDEWVNRGITFWFPSWWHHLLTSYGKKLALILLTPLLMLVIIIIHALKDKGLTFHGAVLSKYKIVYLTALAGVIFWFVTAPDLRLGYGFLIISSLLIFLPFSAVIRPLASKLLIIFMAIALLYFEIALGQGDLASLKTRLLWPAPYPQASLRIVRVDGRVVYVPENKEGLCWYAPLPCTPGPVSGLAFRGPDLQDGFRSRQE